MNAPFGKSFVWRLASALLMAALQGCGASSEEGPDPGPATPVSDAAGRSHEVGPGRLRVISLVPAVTETIEAVGLRERLVARTRYDEQPSLAHLPSVGGGLDPSLEQITQLLPDLVVAWRDAGGMGSLSNRLDELGIPVFQVEIESLADFRRSTRDLARLLDAVPAADSMLATVDAGLSEVREVVNGLPLRTSLFLAQRDPPMAAGPGTFVDSIFAVAGTANVLNDVSQEWPLISLEDVLWRDPDFIVLPVWGLGPADASADVPPEVETLLQAPGWREVPAVAEGRVIAVDAVLFARPGPEMHRAAAALAGQLHPDVSLPAVVGGHSPSLIGLRDPEDVGQAVPRP